METRLNNIDERVRLLGDMKRLELEKENEEIQRRLRNRTPTFFDLYDSYKLFRIHNFSDPSHN